MWQCVLEIEWAEGITVGKDAAMASSRGIAVPILRDSWRQKYGMNNTKKLVDEH